MGYGALKCSRRGQQLLLGYTVCNIGQDGGRFGEDSAIDGEGRYFAQRIDGGVALREIGLCLGVDLDRLVSETRLLERDMTGERAGHRAVKELEHETVVLGGALDPAGHAGGRRVWFWRANHSEATRSLTAEISCPSTTTLREASAPLCLVRD